MFASGLIRAFTFTSFNISISINRFYRYLKIVQKISILTVREVSVPVAIFRFVVFLCGK